MTSTKLNKDGTPSRRGTHPNSHNALKLHGNRGWSHCPQCSKEGCRSPAVRLSPSGRCMAHGGARHARKPTPQRLAARHASCVVAAAKKAGTLSYELSMSPLWKACGPMRFRPHRLTLMAAWSSTDPAAWPAAVAVVEADIAARPILYRRPRDVR